MYFYNIFVYIEVTSIIIIIILCAYNLVKKKNQLIWQTVIRILHIKSRMKQDNMVNLEIRSIIT